MFDSHGPLLARHIGPLLNHVCIKLLTTQGAHSVTHFQISVTCSEWPLTLQCRHALMASYLAQPEGEAVRYLHSCAKRSKCPPPPPPPPCPLSWCKCHLTHRQSAVVGSIYGISLYCKALSRPMTSKIFLLRSQSVCRFCDHRHFGLYDSLGVADCNTSW